MKDKASSPASVTSFYMCGWHLNPDIHTNSVPPLEWRLDKPLVPHRVVGSSVVISVGTGLCQDSG